MDRSMDEMIGRSFGDCEVCGNSPMEGGYPTFRVNPKGETGIFRCRKCLDPETIIDTQVLEIVSHILPCWELT